MVRKSPLRVVEPGEAAVPPKVLTLSEAVQAGDYLEILLAQRREIVESLPDEKGPAKAALHRQLSLLSKEIEALQSHAKEEADDAAEIADEAWDEEAI